MRSRGAQAGRGDPARPEGSTGGLRLGREFAVAAPGSRRGPPPGAVSPSQAQRQGAANPHGADPGEATRLRIVVAQFGGPTTVLNASLHGALEALHAGGAEVLAARGGARGLLAEPLAPLPGPPPRHLLRTPGAALGAGRFAVGAAEVATVAARLRGMGVEACLLMGGNGTMGLALALHVAGLRVAAVPKTIDNDIVGTDHTPGYPSAAAFVAGAVADLATDLRAMAGFEDVRLIEVMGRRAGWLAAAAALARTHPEDLPQLILLPEVPVRLDAFCAEVAARHRRDGSVLVVVAEGVCDPDGRPWGLQALDASGRTQVLGAAARHLAEELRSRLGLSVRAESLGFLPRCLRGAARPSDRAEARALGRCAATALLAGRGGIMAAIAPRQAPKDGPRYIEVPLGEVAGRERLLPAGMRDMGPAFLGWLRPLVGGQASRTRAWP